jgi:hypothetical protein
VASLRTEPPPPFVEAAAGRSDARSNDAGGSRSLADSAS